MFFSLWFRRGGKRRQRIEYENPGEKLLRSLLLAALIGGVCWAFWQNSDNYVQKFKAESRISDEAGLLGAERKQEMARILSRIEENFGVRVHVKVSLVPLLPTDARPEGIFFGVCPGFRQCAFLMPEDWRQGLGEGFLIRLGEEIMRPAMTEGGDWPAAAVKVLELLEQRLGQLAAGQGDAASELFK
ncbi:MAG: hypothetical protein LBV80_07490 [Deltaproteobacteria bacterium]|nr:hypothetical protein [Deltaproteobacteria bacterium]